MKIKGSSHLVIDETRGIFAIEQGSQIFKQNKKIKK